MAVKRIYALQAHGERGKSTTLKKLVLQILRYYNVDFYRIDGRKVTESELNTEIINEAKPYSEVKNLCGTIKVKEKTIAVNTAGDNAVEIGKTMNLFESEVDIGVCSVRMKGTTINRLNEFAQNHNLVPDNYFVIGKLNLSNADKKSSSHIAMINKMNDIQADMMFEEIKQII